MQSRYYDPEIGRFINADEPKFIGLNNSIASHNAYEYCNADPVNKIDKNGFFTTATAIGFGVSNAWNPAGWFVLGGLIIIGAINVSTSYISFDNSSESVGDYTVVGSADLVLPKVDTTAISISRAQVISFADAKIRDTVKPRGHIRYWTATVFPDYVDIGRPIVRSVAIEEVKKGRNVFTVTRAEAEDVARSAANNRDPIGPEIDKDKENTIGYYWHYHTHRHGTGHVFYLF